MKSIIAKTALALALVTAATSPVFSQAPAKDSFSREEMLRDLVRNCVAPAFQQLAARCDDLTKAIGEFNKEPSEARFQSMRDAWVSTSLAASGVRCLHVGPLAAPGSTATFTFWQVMPNSIESKIASTRAIDASMVEEMGATTKGLFAVEYLLYGAKGGPNAPALKATPQQMLLDPAAQRRRDYLMAVARDMEAKAGEWEKAWSDTSSQGVPAKFVEGGQQSLNQLVNTVAASLEDVSDKHIHLALVLPRPVSGQIYRIEHSPSETSMQNLITILEGAHKIYRNSKGMGLEDAVQKINMPTATALEQRFEDALAAARAVGPPLEQAIVDARPAVEEAFDKTHMLEVKYKTDLASTLGVTLTFSSADGD
jgi:predicted lipoprotein